MMRKEMKNLRHQRAVDKANISRLKAELASMAAKLDAYSRLMEQIKAHESAAVGYMESGRAQFTTAVAELSHQKRNADTLITQK